MTIRYMNNDGSRWKDVAKGGMDFVLVLPNGERKMRKADWFESFGNFAFVAYRYKGKRFKAFPKSPSGSDTRLPKESPMVHIFHKVEGDSKCRKDYI